MIGLFWELNQQRQMAEARESARSASARSRDVEQQFRDLEMQFDKLTLTCAALWTLLKSQGFTDQHLEAAIREADLSDGRLDGKVRQTTRDCPKCGRTVSKRHKRCLYCGDGRGSASDPFEGL